MIYINLVEFHSQMLHTKFQNHKPSGSGGEDFKRFAIYSPGGHLGHVSLTKLSFPLPKDVPHKIWL